MGEIEINPNGELAYLLIKIAERLERIAVGIERINNHIEIVGFK